MKRKDQSVLQQYRLNVFFFSSLFLFLLQFSFNDTLALTSAIPKKIPMEPGDTVGFALSPQFNYMDIKAYERVYVGGLNVSNLSSNYKLSELIWKSKKVFMGGASGGININHWFHVYGQYQQKLNDGNSHMEDYDWCTAAFGRNTLMCDATGKNWVSYSTHDKTQLKKAKLMEIMLFKSLYLADAFSVDFALGYKKFSWEWDATGGSYIYSGSSSLPFLYRGYRGNFSEQAPLINYEQNYTIPYLGFGATFKENFYSLALMAKYSFLAKADDYDQHLARNKQDRSSYDKATVFGGDLLFSYWAFKRWELFVSVSIEKFSEDRGNATTYVLDTGEVLQNSNGHGVEYTSRSIGMGVSFYPGGF